MLQVRHDCRGERERAAHAEEIMWFQLQIIAQAH